MSWYTPLKKRIGNSFGHYEGQKTGRILNAMVDVERIPMQLTESVSLGNQLVHFQGKVVGEWKWIEEDFPVFNWTGKFACYSSQPTISLMEDGAVSHYFNLRPQLSDDGDVIVRIVHRGIEITPWLKENLDLIMSYVKNGKTDVALWGNQIVISKLPDQGALELVDALNVTSYKTE